MVSRNLSKYGGSTGVRVTHRSGICFLGERESDFSGEIERNIFFSNSRKRQMVGKIHQSIAFAGSK